jgi:hypothetical protein
MEVKYSFRMSGSDIEHTGTLEMEKDKTYAFSRASQQVHDHIATKYGWSSEEIVELNIRLMYKWN